MKGNRTLRNKNANTFEINVPGQNSLPKKLDEQITVSDINYRNHKTTGNYTLRRLLTWNYDDPSSSILQYRNKSENS